MAIPASSEPRITFNPILVTSRNSSRLPQSLGSLPLHDDRERVVEIVLIPIEPQDARIQWQESRLLELSQRINDLVDPLHHLMPSIFSLTAETFPHVYANFMQGYKLFSRRLREEIFYDVREALRECKISLTRDEFAALQRNALVNIDTIKKIRDVIDPNLWNFCSTNNDNFSQLNLYARRIEYIHKCVNEDGQTIEKAQLDIKRQIDRDRIYFIAKISLASIFTGAFGFAVYCGIVMPKY